MSFDLEQMLPLIAQVASAFGVEVSKEELQENVKKTQEVFGNNMQLSEASLADSLAYFMSSDRPLDAFLTEEERAKLPNLDKFNEELKPSNILPPSMAEMMKQIKDEIANLSPEDAKEVSALLAQCSSDFQVSAKDDIADPLPGVKRTKTMEPGQELDAVDFGAECAKMMEAMKLDGFEEALSALSQEVNPTDTAKVMEALENFSKSVNDLLSSCPGESA